MKISKFQSRKCGFTLVEILIVVAILGLLLGMALPNFIKSRTQAQKQVCVENLSQIESAKQIWGVETGKKNGDVAADADLFGATSYMKQKPSCPAGGSYDLTTIGDNAKCTVTGHTL